MSRMLGAPLGGTTRGGQYGVESLAFSLITPPNGIGGGGSCFPSSVTVAPGEPGTPVICCAETLVEPKPAMISRASTVKVGTVFWRRAFIGRCPPSSIVSKLDQSCAANSFHCSFGAALHVPSRPWQPGTGRPRPAQSVVIPNHPILASRSTRSPGRQSAWPSYPLKTP